MEEEALMCRRQSLDVVELWGSPSGFFFTFTMHPPSPRIFFLNKVTVCVRFFFFRFIPTPLTPPSRRYTTRDFYSPGHRFPGGRARESGTQKRRFGFFFLVSQTVSSR